ncbi:MAG: DUF3175 domain-containing protein [Chthoniobacterales bacterium]
MPAKKKKASGKRWSAEVTEHSDALSLEERVFKKRSARAIAESLKHSAEMSKRRKGTPYQSAMSMLNFYINRAGKNLSASRKHILENAKDELRDLFDKKKA